MNVLSIDPGTRNCAWTLLIDGMPQRWGGWIGNHEKVSLDRRCHEITRGISSLIQGYGVEVLASERYFHGPSQSGETIYTRGKFDQCINLVAGHIRVYYIHPVHLKQWVTANHKAKKPEMVTAIIEQLREKCTAVPTLDYEAPAARRFRRGGQSKPKSFLDSILDMLPASDYEHVLESWAIGDFATHCEWLRRGVAIDGLSPAKHELCSRTLKRDNPREPMFDGPMALPPFMGQG